MAAALLGGWASRAAKACGAPAPAGLPPAPGQAFVAGPTSSYVYEAGKPARVTDGLGGVTTFVYDAAGRRPA